MDILIKFHQFTQIFLKFCKLSLIGPQDFLLFDDLVIEVSDFLVVEFDPLVELLRDTALIDKLFLNGRLPIPPGCNCCSELLILGTELCCGFVFI